MKAKKRENRPWHWQRKIFSSDPDLSCLFSWAARSSSWIFLVICSVLRMTSSVLGSVGSDSISRSSSSGMELPSPSQPLLLSLPLLHKLQREIQSKSIPACCFCSKDKTAHYFHKFLLKAVFRSQKTVFLSFPCQLVQTIIWVMLLPWVIHLRVIECVVIVAFWHAALLL